MSATVATAGASTGCLGSARNVFWGTNSSLWWAFALTASTTLAAFSSPDGVTWTARATHTLGIATASEGRDLMVVYKSISSIDTVWFCWVNNATGGGANAVDAVRATISGTTITYHTSDTAIGASVATIATPTFSSGGLELDSNNRVYVANGALDTSQDTAWTRSTADPGSAEQATAPTWAAEATIDTTQTAEVKSGYLFPTATAGNMALVADNASSSTQWTGLSFYTYNGTSWSGTGGNTSVTGSITAVDKNAWGCVARTTTDVHVVYRSSTGSWVHRRWNGTSWGAGQTIPSFSTASGTGTALATDGTNVWLVAIGSDAANTVKYIQWSSAGAAWDAAWTTLEGTTATRTWVSCSRDVGNSQIVVLWHESTTLKAGVIALGGGTTFNQSLSANLTFTGAIAKATATPRSGSLSFTGSLPRAVSKGVSGALSFTGTQRRAITTGVAGGLSFSGAATRAIAKTAFAATLSFTGALASGKQFLRALTATLSFTGVGPSRQVGKVLSGGLTFTGSGPVRAIAKGISAGLSFAGSLPRRTARALAATASFTGSFASSRLFLKALSGGLSFTGATAKLTSRPLAGVLSFSGAQSRLIAKGVGAALGFAGGLGRAIRKGLAAGLGFLGHLVTAGGGQPTGPGHVSAYASIAFRVAAYDRPALSAGAFASPAFRVGAFDSEV